MDHTSDPLLLPFEDVRGSRRGFLQLVGFGIAGAALTGCSRGPVQRLVPALAASGGIVPGRPYSIATTCGGCEAGCGVLARCRDGRPIKLEGSPSHPVSAGGLCPAGQASVLSLYDSHRLEAPLRGGEASTWEQVDAALASAVDEVRRRGGRVRLLTGTVTSPSTRAAIARFVESFGDARHVEYDALSASAILDAHAATHGRRVLPRYRLDRARAIASFGADFLSTWVSPVEHTAAYAAGRALDGERVRSFRHVQLESRLSLTGSRADERVRLAPWEIAPALAAVCDLLEGRAGGSRRLGGAAEAAPHGERLQRLAADLWDARGEALVLADTDDVAVQVLVNYANHLLGGYGATLDVAQPSNQRRGDDAAVGALRAELEADTVDLLLVQGVNPVYDRGAALPVERAKLLVSCAPLRDETSERAHWVLPEPHALECWGDAEPHAGTFSLSQPTVPPLREARTLRATLARLSGDERDDAELVRATWREDIAPRVGGGGDFTAFFDAALSRGHVVAPAGGETTPAFDTSAVRRPTAPAAPPEGALGLVLYPKAGMGDGRHAHNPWLHELPDPVTKITWDNYACLSPDRARALDLEEGDLVRVLGADGAEAIELPVHVQRGQHDDVVAVAVGYGRLGTDRFTGVGPDWIDALPTVEPGGTVGVDAGPLRGARGVTLAAAGGSVKLAATQDYHSLDMPEHLAIEGHETRDAAREMSLGQWRSDPAAALHEHHGEVHDLWKEDHPLDRRWGLTVDLSRCTGCSACVIGCQAENNVPVVGRDEVRRHREMSWLRIDRYYQGDGDEMRVQHQPMMCQHCDHAPCESVCPVLATVHSDEGLNQQVYNRCVGTRYCANTCPYKVRRFNWFDYAHEDELQNHSLNPDVTVRSRGVMEKCSFCVQRIQDAKSEARRAGREVRDGDVQTACQQSCPAQAIVFGDLNDADSRVAELAHDPRSYEVLGELNVQPSVRYLARVHNGTTEDESHAG